MPAWGSYSYLFGPVVSLAALGLLVWLMRWATTRRPMTREQDEQLVRVLTVPTVVEAQVVRLRLQDAGLRAALAPPGETPGVLVCAGDLPAARRMLAG